MTGIAANELNGGWRLSPQVALRPESFGALAYHFGSRRLSFVKSPQLLRVVETLADHPDPVAVTQRGHDLVGRLLDPPQGGGLLAAAGQRGGPDSHYSSAKLGANYASNGQVQAYLRGDLWSKSENYLFVPDLRWLDTDRKTWGLGSFDTDQQKYPMSFKLSRVYATFYRRLAGPVYLGAGYHYDQFNKIVDDRARMHIACHDVGILSGKGRHRGAQPRPQRRK